MVRSNEFKAYNRERTRLQEIASSPVRVRHHRVDCREWSTGPHRISGSRNPQRRRVALKTKRRTLTAAAILRYKDHDIGCLHCGRAGNDPECGAHCYRDFRKTILTAEGLIEIRHVGSLGCGAFTKSWACVKKDQYLDEYFGDLRPFDSEQAGSLYNFFVPDRCIIDAEKAGNWTRFMNSSCRPNVRAEPNFVGKRCCVIFKAIRDIGPGEELVFNYGKRYFHKAGFPCKCSVCRPRRAIREEKKQTMG